MSASDSAASFGARTHNPTSSLAAFDPDAVRLDSIEYDTIVVGTGLVNSIVAAALAKQAKRRVLHVDVEEWYGGATAACTLQDVIHVMRASASAGATTTANDHAHLEAWKQATGDTAATATTPAEPLYDYYPFAPHATITSSTPKPVIATSTSTFSIATRAHAASFAFPPTTTESKATSDEAVTTATSTTSSEQSLLAQSRRFTLDLNPHLVSARSPLIDLIISSNVASYIDFKAIDHVLLYVPTQGGDGDGGGGFQRVPVSRSDVFSSSLLSLLDKRKLMQFLQSIAGSEKLSAEQNAQQFQEIERWFDKPFTEFLASRELPERVLSFIQYGMGLFDHSFDASAPLVTTREAVTRMRLFLGSLGRFTSGAFVYPVYGSSELPQAFSRLAAVNGATYILRFAPRCIVVDRRTQRVAGIVTPAGQFLRCTTLVCDQDLWSMKSAVEGVTGVTQPAVESSSSSSSSVSSSVDSAGSVVSRAILIAGAPWRASDGSEVPNLSVCIVPPYTFGNAHPIRVFHVGTEASACPSGKYAIYLSTPSTADRNPHDDFAPLIAALFRTSDSDEHSQPKRPQLLFQSFYQHREKSALSSSSSSSSSSPQRIPLNAFITCDPFLGIAFDDVVERARHAFDGVMKDDDVMRQGDAASLLPLPTLESALKYVEQKKRRRQQRGGNDAVGGEGGAEDDDDDDGAAGDGDDDDDDAGEKVDEDMLVELERLDRLVANASAPAQAASAPAPTETPASLVKAAPSSTATAASAAATAAAALADLDELSF